MCGQKSSKLICPGFDPVTPLDCVVTPLDRVDILNGAWLFAACWFIAKIEENSIISLNLGIFALMSCYLLITNFINYLVMDLRLEVSFWVFLKALIKYGFDKGFIFKLKFENSNLSNVMLASH